MSINLDDLDPIAAPSDQPIYIPTPEEVAAALADADLMNENMRLYGTIDKPQSK